MLSFCKDIWLNPQKIPKFKSFYYIQFRDSSDFSTSHLDNQSHLKVPRMKYSHKVKIRYF